MNAFDKVITAISPEKGLKRELARKKMSLLNSGYGNYGANQTKKAIIGWNYRGGSHKEDIEDNVDTLRQRSRDLYSGGANIATAAIKTLRTNTIGTGLHLKSTVDEEILGISELEARQLETVIEREFSIWADTINCDIERIDNFYQLQQLALMNELLSGDVFVMLPTTNRVGSIYDLRINLIEADRVSTPDTETGNMLFCEGVEKNKMGEVIAYHVSNFHPLSFDYSTRTWARVQAFGDKTGRRNILHVMNRERIGQVRGVPFISPIIESLKSLGRYTESEIVAAVVNSLFTVFIEKEGAGDGAPIGESVPEEMQVDSEDESSIELAPGAVIDLGEGEKANMVNPGRPNPNYDPFVMSIIKQMGAALEIPFEILLKCFSNNYSASRGAILEFFKVIKMYRSWFIADFCQPIFEEFMCEAVAKGRIVAPGFFNDPVIKKAYCSAEWNGPSSGQLDPKKEVEAAELRVQGGYSTRERETTELTGGDYYRNIKQRKREEKLLKEVTEIAGISKKETMEANANGGKKSDGEPKEPGAEEEEAEE